MTRSLLPVLAVLFLGQPTRAAEPLPPANLRFANAEGDEVPGFQRHILPLLGRVGCNGRACHGSFQGQAGFRLSLFGYDFKADHDALLGGNPTRIDRKNPADSLLLAKPTKTVAHKGGQRIDPGSWQYNVLLRWLKAGAPTARETDSSFAALDIEPHEIRFDRAGQTSQLKIMASWADGTREDVTPLCRFRSNDESIASVNPAGLVSGTGKGDTHIVAFYDNGVVTVPVLMPVSDRVGPRYPEVATPTKIDELVVAKLRKLGIVPSDLCSDAEFLRRVSLDMTGTLPSPAEVQAFLADTRADRRSRKIDELLTRPTYAAWWSTRICDSMGNSERNGPLGGEQALNREKARQAHAWVAQRVRDNMPYDKLVEGVVLAVGRGAEQTYDAYCEEMSSYFRKDAPADFAARPTMPYFWTRRSLGSPEGKALSFAYAFLGVSLQCAQCHKHPYDQWTKQDFDQFSAFFNGIRYGEVDRAKAAEMKKAVNLVGDEDSGDYKRKFVDLLQNGKLLPFKNLAVPAPPKGPRKPVVNARGPGGRVLTPRLLGGEEVIAANFDDPRRPLMDWMREADNPYFARAFVNRVWAGYFSVGLIDPPDDLNLANPASNRELLDDLSRRFVASGYDMKWLHREIANSQTYQRSWQANDTNRLDERNLSRAVVRRLPAEVAYDAIVLATASDDARAALDRDPVTTRAIGASSGFAGARDAGAYAVNLFGKPPRVINCDCERSTEPSLLQTVYLRNDDEVSKLLDRPDGWLKQMVKAKERDPKLLVSGAYLRVLGRLPDEREAARSIQHLIAGDANANLRDLMWALLNTKEFILNR